ncbi:hypothetical protein G6F37_009164 [Rhizopus arrhizus]|nr:hypothetical protein G6F38_002504 [Rhizopus arrhizus]KAG1154752.1 hypothetical protein G6F37_009164 [Rhizopus arrhizus]
MGDEQEHDRECRQCDCQRVEPRGNPSKDLWTDNDGHELCFQQLIELIRQGSLERALAAEEEHPSFLLELERTMAFEDSPSCGSTASTRSAAENGKRAERGQSVQRESRRGDWLNRLVWSQEELQKKIPEWSIGSKWVVQDKEEEVMFCWVPL